MSDSVLELRGISLRREGVRILREIDWRIEAGEHWALLGANGSGKTTLLKVITGYEWPSAGEVRVLGREYGACDLRILRREIGLVSHALEERLHPSDSALETVLSGLDASFGLYREFTPEERAAAAAALASVGCAQIAERKTALLSQGEKQRLILARALVGNPRLLILDEPCIGLDPAAREDFLLGLRAVACARQAPTLLLVTHHIEEIGPWVKGVLLLRGGRVLAAGDPGRVMTGDLLSRAFGRPLRVRRRQGRWSLLPGETGDASPGAGGKGFRVQETT